jgi:hypothetical protein
VAQIEFTPIKKASQSLANRRLDHLTGALAVQITPVVLSGESPQPVATFHAAVGTQRNHYRQLFKEI